jgi:hypothetical protein
MKYCKDCTFYNTFISYSDGGVKYICEAFPTREDVILGKVTEPKLSCYAARDANGKCGPDAKAFQSKILGV